MPEAEATIDAIINQRVAPKKEKVQYVSQVTRYGFRNLFAGFQYNPTMPYQSQINPQAELFIQDYMKAHGRHLQGMKSWGQPYFNLIDGILSQYGLPRELRYIAVIESNLSTGATSSAGAGGPWQFMPGTARDMGLTVSPYLDERRDYVKSTHAAARYLLSLYRDLRDWLLVMAAYNGGPGRVYIAIQRSGSRNFWQLQYYLPEESRTYVKRFIATHFIMEGGGGVTTMDGSGTLAWFDPASETTRTQYGKSAPDPYTAPVTTEEVEVLPISGRYHSVVIAKHLAMDIAAFNKYNPQFDTRLTSQGSYDLRLPPDKMQSFQLNKFHILNESVQLLLGDAQMPVNRTTYPASKTQRKQGK
jgi:membrane-bound lytic murein transglycosylase D